MLMYPFSQQLNPNATYTWDDDCSPSEAGSDDVWDIWARFNSDAPFYYESTGMPPAGQFDFVRSAFSLSLSLWLAELFFSLC